MDPTGKTHLQILKHVCEYGCNWRANDFPTLKYLCSWATNNFISIWSSLFHAQRIQFNVLKCLFMKIQNTRTQRLWLTICWNEDEEQQRTHGPSDGRPFVCNLPIRAHKLRTSPAGCWIIPVLQNYMWNWLKPSHPQAPLEDSFSGYVIQNSEKSFGIWISNLWSAFFFCSLRRFTFGRLRWVFEQIRPARLQNRTCLWLKCTQTNRQTPAWSPISWGSCCCCLLLNWRSCICNNAISHSWWCRLLIGTFHPTRWGR